MLLFFVSLLGNMKYVDLACEISLHSEPKVSLVTWENMSYCSKKRCQLRLK